MIPIIFFFEDLILILIANHLILEFSRILKIFIFTSTNLLVFIKLILNRLLRWLLFKIHLVFSLFLKFGLLFSFKLLLKLNLFLVLFVGFRFLFKLSLLLKLILFFGFRLFFNLSLFLNLRLIFNLSLFFDFRLFLKLRFFFDIRLSFKPKFFFEFRLLHKLSLLLQLSFFIEFILLIGFRVLEANTLNGIERLDLFLEFKILLSFLIEILHGLLLLFCKGKLAHAFLQFDKHLLLRLFQVEDVLGHPIEQRLFFRRLLLIMEILDIDIQVIDHLFKVAHFRLLGFGLEWGLFGQILFLFHCERLGDLGGSHPGLLRNLLGFIDRRLLDFAVDFLLGVFRFRGG